MTIALTRILNVSGPLSKSFTLKDGQLTKTTAAVLFAGVAAKIEVADLRGLSFLIDELGTDQALTFGVTRYLRARVVTQKMANGRCSFGTVCRDHEHFKWPKGRGVFMLDVDRPRDGSTPFRALDFDALLCKLLPWWSGVARMYRPSASAFIYTQAGEELVGNGSIRCYAIVDNAENIPFLGVMVADVLWHAGYGRIEFSKAGSRLVRCPIDTAVWQPERLDFAGPVLLGPGLMKRDFPPLIFDGSDIDGEAALADFGKRTYQEWSTNSLEVRKAWSAARPEETRRKNEVIEERVQAEVNRGANPKQARQKWENALKYGVLSGSYELNFVDGVATVNEVLADQCRFNLKRLADPQEPDYACDSRIAIFFANGGRVKPHIFSHAHGGKKYTLIMGAD